jgi:predicted phosphodiesterase
VPVALTKKSATLRLRESGALRLAIVADTHSLPHPKTIGHLAARRPDAILHAGDIGDLEVLDALAGAQALPDILVLDLVGDERGTRLLLLHIGVSGPRLRADVARLARSEGASVVVCGHSHVPFIGRDRELTIFNPGSVGPRRFHLPIVFGTMDLTPTEVRLGHIDCETGEPWMPPS